MKIKNHLSLNYPLFRRVIKKSNELAFDFGMLLCCCLMAMENILPLCQDCQLTQAHFSWAGYRILLTFTTVLMRTIKVF